MLTKLINNRYKIFISIIFGFLGFFINFQTIIFPFGEYTAAILLGLLFPMLITLCWGWKYGLLSALAGGCQSMWWLWGPSNGYAIFFVVLPFTLWVVWHGICANLRRKQKVHKWWLSMYIVEIPFRIFSSINLLMLSRWAITLNPPSWSWCSNAPNSIPMHFSVFVTIKQAAVGFVILLFADVLLNFRIIRKFFKLKEYIDHKKTGFIISAFLLIGCLFWLLDSIFYSFVFHTESSFINLLALDIPDYNIFIRTVFLIFCLICGLITSRILRRQREDEIALKESEEGLFQIIQGNSIATFVINKEHKVTHWNKAAENLTGFSAKEMIGTKNQWKPFYPQERPLMADVIVNELPDKKIKKYYAEKYRKSSLVKGAFEGEDFFPKMGEKGKWLFFTAAPLKDHNGKIIGAIETLQDITKSKLSEEMLKSSETLYRSTIDSMNERINVMDTDLRILLFNASITKWCRELNINTDNVIGKSLCDVFPFLEKKEIRDEFIQVIKTKKTLTSQETHKFGESEIITETRKIPVIDNGKVTRIINIITDITEQKKAEKELKRYHEHLEELVKERTAELEEKNKELERYNSLFEGREFRIKELKDKVKELEKKH
ncbi:MAG: PAS domain S-box protein [Candidatus Cloacimonetes bacterium]|nr:PAS domain S-box protein [Candidatus Cloacimonadota bacterium]